MILRRLDIGLNNGHLSRRHLGYAREHYSSESGSHHLVL